MQGYEATGIAQPDNEDAYLKLRESLVQLRKEYNSRDQKCRE